ncbi:unnamed protein product [Moneuplotes crassus]|uniref:Uncharacterized protein n=1 Tax=Euplotes crassus TaxID=5936 RepID=A0AAD1XDU6_EUPCR|nr:unnamed protein product [Moneuplotes crassus]
MITSCFELEENLSEEILDENVGKLSIMKPFHLENRISSSPFKKRPKKIKLSKISSVPSDNKRYKFWVSQNDPSVKNIRWCGKKESSQSVSTSTNLQSDIRSLLRKAIQLRNHRSYECSGGSNPCVRDSPLDKKAKTVTNEVSMKDIKNPFIFKNY